jgi:hypothetical protein
MAGRTQVPTLDGGTLASAFSPKAAEVIVDLLTALREMEGRLSAAEGELSRMATKDVELEQYVNESIARLSP